MRVNWKGVFPALTTQFKPDQALDLPATAKHLETLIQAGIHGVVLLGTVGENTALAYEEKLSVLCEMRKTAAGRFRFSPGRPSTPLRSPAGTRAMQKISVWTG